MNGAQIVASNLVTIEGSPAVPVATWSVAGLGDFNGDGTADFLWRNQNGTLVDWTMNGSQITSSQTVTFGGSPATPNSSWNVAGIGDFNGDGKDDVLWRNTNGSLVDWTMNGSQVTASQQVTTGGSAATPDSSWSVAGIGDFNGDGKADVLWRNTNGSLIDWTMNGSQIALGPGGHDGRQRGHVPTAPGASPALATSMGTAKRMCCGATPTGRSSIGR